MFSEKQTTVVQSISEDAIEEAELSFQFTKEEHSLSWWDAMRLHYPAIGWGLFMNLVSQLIPKMNHLLTLPGDYLERH
jgi:hypothetical protein